MIHSFSIPVIGTDMSQVLQGGGAENLLMRLVDVLLSIPSLLLSLSPLSFTVASI